MNDRHLGRCSDRAIDMLQDRTCQQNEAAIGVQELSKRSPAAVFV